MFAKAVGRFAERASDVINNVGTSTIYKVQKGYMYIHWKTSFEKKLFFLHGRVR